MSDLVERLREPIDNIDITRLAQRLLNERAEAADALERAERERDEAREALTMLAGAHVPDKPAAAGRSDLEHIQRHVMWMRSVARSALAADLDAPLDLRNHPDFPGEWERIFGKQRKWTWLSDDARKYGKHFAANDAQVGGLLERLKTSDPAGADTLASMIFFRQLADNREVMAWQQVDEARAQSHVLSQTQGEEESSTK